MQTVALTIAGSDPSGGAGVQADIKIFQQFGVYGEAVLTLLTVQNTQGVFRVEPLPAALVREQIEAVVDDIPPVAAKTGALGNLEIVEEIAALAASYRFPLVVDPVMISTQGARLLSSDAVSALRTTLLPQARVVTPNLPEAELLASMEIKSEDNVREAARRILALGCKAVLIKGGHSPGDPVDYLFEGDEVLRFPGQRVNTAHTHGTGCVYSAAITASLASGSTLRDAVATARDFIQRAIATAPGLGRGNGPVNHFTPVRALKAAR